jgi:hypothetical protein
MTKTRVVLLASLVFAGCSSVDATGPDGGGAGGSGGVPMAEGPPDAGAGDAQPDGNDAAADADAPHADAGCSSQDIAAICAINLECPPTWAEVLAHPDCAGASLGAFDREYREDCGPYHVRRIDHPDYGALYFYDIATGALVEADFGGDNGHQSCVSTVAGGVGLNCSNGPWTNVCNDDGTVRTN